MRKSTRPKAASRRPKFEKSVTSSCTLYPCILICACVQFCTAAVLEGGQVPPRKPQRHDSTKLEAAPRDTNVPDAVSKVAVAPRKPDPPLIISSAGAEDASEQGQKNLDDRLPAAKSPSTDLGRQLWRTAISAYKEPADSHSKSRLQRVIGQIRAVKLNKREQTPKTTMVESILKTEPNEPSQGAPAPENLQPDAGPISKGTLEILQARLQNPEQLANPLNLAEILFRTGYRPQAAICYREALKRIDPNEPGAADDIAWILFQLGDCLTDQDPSKAIETYTTLVDEYPESIWTGPAKARRSLVAWCQQAQPRALIDPNDKPVARAINQVPTTKQQ